MIFYFKMKQEHEMHRELASAVRSVSLRGNLEVCCTAFAQILKPQISGFVFYSELQIYTYKLTHSNFCLSHHEKKDPLPF